MLKADTIINGKLIYSPLHSHAMLDYTTELYIECVENNVVHYCLMIRYNNGDVGKAKSDSITIDAPSDYIRIQKAITQIVCAFRGLARVVVYTQQPELIKVYTHALETKRMWQIYKEWRRGKGLIQLRNETPEYLRNLKRLPSRYWENEGWIIPMVLRFQGSYWHSLRIKQLLPDLQLINLSNEVFFEWAEKVKDANPLFVD